MFSTTSFVCRWRVLFALTQRAATTQKGGSSIKRKPLQLMKKKTTSRSAFFNLRVLIGLCVVLAGVCLALLSFGTFSGITASSAQAQQKRKIINVPGLPPGFDCSKIHELGIDKQENLRAGAIMIACGEAEGGSASSSVGAVIGVSKMRWRPWRLALRTSTWSPARRLLPTLPSRRHSLRLTRITPTKSLWPTTTHAVATPVLSTSPAHRPPPTAARPSPD